METPRLFDSENPLEERLGATFFKELPTAPGVYRFFGKNGRLLYVGKAKDLRKRLFTYRNVRPARHSRKVVRMVRMVYSAKIEVMPSEQEALLRENELIRNEKPEFNHAKKNPETYYYISVQSDRTRLVTDLRMHLRDEPDTDTFGAFKGHRTIRRALGALLRQLYIMANGSVTPFDLPALLVNRLTPMHYEMNFSAPPFTGYGDQLKTFFSGEDNRLLYSIIGHANEQTLLEHFIGKMILSDMEALNQFYRRCARRNRKIQQQFALKSSLIPQDKLDDYLVRLAFSMKGSESDT